MVTFNDVVHPRPIITNTEAIWTDRTPVKPLALHVRRQLLKMMAVCSVGSNDDADILQYGTPTIS